MKMKHLEYGSYPFWGGIAAVLFTILPYLLLKENAIFVYSDQLDGEMVAYILQAKHLFQGGDIAEFMGGMPKSALTPPAPLAVILFLSGNYCQTLVLMNLIGKLCGYIGMYLLVREAAGERWIAVSAAFLYSSIPFAEVYGLSEFGIPLLFWCFLQLRKKKHLWIAFLYTGLYALSSSLVLVGFGILGMIQIWLLFFAARKEKRRKEILFPEMAWLVLLLVYVAENLSLLGGLFGIGEKIVSHKSEYVLTPRPFGEIFFTSLLAGNQHGQSYHLLLAACIFAAMAVGSFSILRCRKNTLIAEVSRQTPQPPKKPELEQRQLMNGISPLLRAIAACLGWNLLFALLSAAWGSEAGIELRSRLSFLGAFQLDRVLWIAPCLWYLAAACSLAVVYRFWQIHSKFLFFLLPMAAAFVLTGLWCLYSGEFKLNVQKLRNPDYGIFSYRDYYAIGVMEQVREFLDDYTGKNVDEYRVVSLGIDPAAALYHGFYCLDGYSNHYPLEYKKKFRKIILPELERNEYLRQYYDNWGNRCYLFSSECPGYYTIEKHGFSYMDYRINTKALYKMGGRYLLSAALIQNAEGQGLSLLREKPFETEDSYYCIYIYEVVPE